MLTTRTLKLTLAALCALLLALPASSSAITPVEQFGPTGGGDAAGQIGIGAEGVVVANDGTVFVADPTNRRIDAFAPDGTFLRAFGWDVVPGDGHGFEICTTVCQAGDAGGGAGQLSSPVGLAIAQNQSLYVADSVNERIDVFGQDGSFHRAFGWDVVPGGGGGFDVCSAVCQAGSAGGAPGQLDDPTGVTVGAGGDLYVAERGCVSGCPPGPSGNRISVFGANEAFSRAFGWDVVPGGPAGFEICTAQTGCQDGTASGQAGGLTHPQSIGISGSGELFVSEPDANRVSVFGTAETQFLGAFGKDVIPGGSGGFEVCSAASGCQAGIAGGAAGEMSSPAGVLSALNDVYVADSQNQRLQQFSSAGAFEQAFGRGVISGGSGFEVCTTFCQSGLSGIGSGEFSTPTGVAIDCRGAVYVTDSGNGRIEKFAQSDLRLPPCPDNSFKFGKTKLNKRHGTARITVLVGNPGTVAGIGHGVRRRTVFKSIGGNAILRVNPKGRVRHKLRKHHRAAVAIKVTYTPSNGDPNTKVKRLTLRQPQRHNG